MVKSIKALSMVKSIRDIIGTIRNKGQIRYMYQAGLELAHPFIYFKNPWGQILEIFSVDQHGYYAVEN